MDTNNLEVSQQEANIIETERTILGIAMRSPKAFPEIYMSLTPDDFFTAPHKLIYEAIIKTYTAGQAITTVTIAEQLKNENNLERAGGLEYISQISDTFYTDEIVMDYIDLAFKSAAGRKFDRTLSNVVDLRKKTNDINVVLPETQQMFLDIEVDAKKNDVKSIGVSSNELIKKVQELEQSDNALTGVTTGFTRLDKITSGLQPGDFIILAARPSMGKTAFALNLAQNAAMFSKQNNAVAIFSVEMPTEQLTQRIVSSMTSIDATKLRTGQGLSGDDWKTIHLANDRLQEAKIFVDDTPGITIQQIQSKLHKLKRDHQVNLCVIDYLQLITTPGSNGSDRQGEISNISRQLKRIARDTGIPIICLSQLSRSVEKREDKRPIMSDLRDSGAIEQDADIIMFLYRKEYYDNATVEDREQNPIHETELIIAKHRNGATGTVELAFNLRFGKFMNRN